MSVLMEHPRTAGVRSSVPRSFVPPSRRAGQIQGVALSIALHAALFFLGGFLWVKPISYGITAGETAVEVELLAAPAAPEAVPAAPEAAPQPEWVAAEPDPLEKSEPTIPKPVEKPAPARPAPAAAPAVVPAVARVSDGSSAVPGKDLTTQHTSGAQIAARPNYLRNPAPRYPEASRKNGEEGLVILAVNVSPAGRPVTVELFGSSGYERLDRAAVDAVRRWIFEPARLGPLPVASMVKVPVRFRLNEQR